MALITIQRTPGAAFEQVDDSTLVCERGISNTADEYTTWVEYRLRGSDVVVHRSVHITLKTTPPGMAALIGEVTSG